MQRGVAILQSIATHGLILVVAWLAALDLWREEIEVSQPVLTVDIVATVDVTNLAEGIETETPEPEEEPEPPQPAPAPPPPPPPPPPPEPETVEEVALPEDAPEERPEVAPEAAPAPPPPPPPPPPRESRQARDDREKEERKAALTTALQNLSAPDASRQTDADEDKEDEKKEAEKVLDDIAGQALNTVRQNNAPLGADIITQLRHRISQCWNPPTGATGADTLKVVLRIRLDRGGAITSVDIRDATRFASDGFFRAAAEAARRAIIECSPYDLPEDQYDKWKLIDFTFDPRFITRS